MRIHLMLLALVALSGCVTRFYGEPQFPGGARACFDRCQAEHMEMDAFVYHGEFSSSCACRTRPAMGQAGDGSGHASSAAIAASAGMSAVVLQSQ